MSKPPLLRCAVLAAITLAFNPAHAEGHAPHWSYTGHGGATRWAELAPDFQTCKLGKNQSPIDIPTKKVAKLDPVRPIGFGYAAGEAEVVNNGHTIQVNLPTGGKITVGGTEYTLAQFHFHTPSEEKFDGKPYPLVAHLVHKSAQGGLAVVAVLFKQGHENAALKPVFAAMPAKEGEKTKLGGAFDPAALLPADKAYYAFDGSLTTPPCSEDVKWHVLRTPVEASAAQLAAFKKLYPMNARPVQALNGRKLGLSD